MNNLLRILGSLGFAVLASQVSASGYYSAYVNVSGFSNDCVMEGITKSEVNCSGTSPSNPLEEFTGYARSEPGSLGISGMTKSTWYGYNGNAGHIDVVTSARSTDVLTFDVDSGFLKLPVFISGNFSVSATDSVGFGGGRVTSAIFYFGGDSSAISVFDAALITDGSQLTHTIYNGNYGKNTVLLPFSGGSLNLFSTFVGSTYCPYLSPGQSCNSQFSFGNSANFLAASVLDTSMNEVLGTTISSASGFDYATGFVAAAVPIPASLPLTFSAAMSLMALRGLRRKA